MRAGGSGQVVGVDLSAQMLKQFFPDQLAALRCDLRIDARDRLGGGVEELLEGWAAGPMRAELLALDPERAQQFRDCLSREVLRFTRDGALITPSIARLAVASAPTQA